VNPIEFVWKLLWTAWPFVKEMVLEGHSLKHALVFNRRRALFGIAIMVSFFFNIVNIGADARMVRILSSYVTLQKDYKALSLSDKQLKLQLSGGCQVTIPAPASDASGAVPGEAGYNVLRSSFTQLNADH
jgi:hypothetical protein